MVDEFLNEWTGDPVVLEVLNLLRRRLNDGLYLHRLRLLWLRLLRQICQRVDGVTLLIDGLVPYYHWAFFESG